MLALTALAHDRSLPQAVVLDAMQVALEHAYKKDSNGQDVRVDIDLESGDQVVRTIRTVAEDIEDEVAALPGGENIHRCWQCGSCTNSCTVGTRTSSSWKTIGLRPCRFLKGNDKKLEGIFNLINENKFEVNWGTKA